MDEKMLLYVMKNKLFHKLKILLIVHSNYCFTLSFLDLSLSCCFMGSGSLTALGGCLPPPNDGSSVWAGRFGCEPAFAALWLRTDALLKSIELGRSSTSWSSSLATMRLFRLKRGARSLFDSFKWKINYYLNK